MEGQESSPAGDVVLPRVVREIFSPGNLIQRKIVCPWAVGGPAGFPPACVVQAQAVALRPRVWHPHPVQVRANFVLPLGQDGAGGRVRPSLPLLANLCSQRHHCRVARFHGMEVVCTCYVPPGAHDVRSVRVGRREEGEERQGEGGAERERKRERVRYDCTARHISLGLKRGVVGLGLRIAFHRHVFGDSSVPVLNYLPDVLLAHVAVLALVPLLAVPPQDILAPPPGALWPLLLYMLNRLGLLPPSRSPSFPLRRPLPANIPRPTLVLAARGIGQVPRLFSGDSDGPLYMATSLKSLPETFPSGHAPELCHVS